MPANTRTWARREILATVKNIEAGQTHLLKVVNLYIDDNPEIATNLQFVVETQNELIKLLHQTRSSF